MTERLRRDDPATLNDGLAARRQSRWRRLGAVIAVLGATGLLASYGSKPEAQPQALIDASARAARPATWARAADCLQSPQALQDDLSRIAATFDGKVGIAVTQAGCNWVVGARQDELFPQQSVSKLWVALGVMDAVDRGALQLDQPLTLLPQDLVVFNQPMRWELLRQGSITLPVGSLLHSSLSLSDNLANDKLLWTLGGPGRVRQLLDRHELDGIRFGPGERLLQSGIAGVKWSPELADGNNFERARAQLPLGQRQQLLTDYVANPVDGATPAGIARALGRLAMGDLLSPDATRTMLDIMQRSRSGPRRLKAGVPPGWKVYHKTGTGQELRGLATGYNDVGIIAAPDGRKYGVAVMVGATRQPIQVRTAMMQAVSRAVVSAHSGG